MAGEAGDPVAALIAILSAALEMDTIFGAELPAEMTAQMPIRALVIKPSGGVSINADSFAEFDTQRVDLFAYGATPADAGALGADASLALRRVRRQVAAATLVHWVKSAGGYSSGREPDTDWPRVWQSFQLMYALESIP